MRHGARVEKCTRLYGDDFDILTPNLAAFTNLTAQRELIGMQTYKYVISQDHSALNVSIWSRRCRIDFDKDTDWQPNAS